MYCLLFCQLYWHLLLQLTTPLQSGRVQTAFPTCNALLHLQHATLADLRAGQSSAAAAFLLLLLLLCQLDVQGPPQTLLLVLLAAMHQLQAYPHLPATAAAAAWVVAPWTVAQTCAIPAVIVGGAFQTAAAGLPAAGEHVYYC
jgi:hypothetical protein